MIGEWSRTPGSDLSVCYQRCVHSFLFQVWSTASGHWYYGYSENGGPKVSFEGKATAYATMRRADQEAIGLLEDSIRKIRATKPPAASKPPGRGKPQEKEALWAQSADASVQPKLEIVLPTGRASASQELISELQGFRAALSSPLAKNRLGQAIRLVTEGIEIETAMHRYKADKAKPKARVKKPRKKT